MRFYFKEKSSRSQREELVQTREELKGQKLMLKAQNETMRKQNFEDTFFQLLRNHTENVTATDIRNRSTKEVIATGRDCFTNFYGEVRQQLHIVGDPETDGLRKINIAYEKFYNIYQSDLDHYFRTLYHIIKFVDKSEAGDKKLYTNLVRAQLSTHELALIFYNCLSEKHGRAKFKPLLEKYALLKNLPLNLLFQKDHIQLYEPQAFGKVNW